MAKRQLITEKSALKSKEEDLRRLAKWHDTLNGYGESSKWDSEDKAKIIDYLQCQFIVGTSWRPGWG